MKEKGEELEGPGKYDLIWGMECSIDKTRGGTHNGALGIGKKPRNV